MRVRLIAAVSIPALLACACAAPLASPTPVIVASVAAPPPVAPIPSVAPAALPTVAPADPCGLFDPGKLGIYGTVSFDVSPVAPRPPGWRASEHAWCLPTPRGAWGVVFDAEAKTWQFAHASTEGKLARVDKPVSLNDQHYEFKITVLNDYDEDGEPEVFVAQDGMSRLSPPLHYRTLYTWRRGASGDAGSVIEYPAAKGLPLAEMRDVDQDGRMDFGLFVPFPKDVTGVLFAGSLVPPTLLAHALPDGTFSFRDAVAKADLRRQCPKQPAPVTAKDFEGEDLAEAIEAVACSVYWRVPRALLQGQIKRACRSTQNCDGLLALATETPPFTLP